MLSVLAACAAFGSYAPPFWKRPTLNPPTASCALKVDAIVLDADGTLLDPEHKLSPRAQTEPEPKLDPRRKLSPGTQTIPQSPN